MNKTKNTVKKQIEHLVNKYTINEPEKKLFKIELEVLVLLAEKELLDKQYLKVKEGQDKMNYYKDNATGSYYSFKDGILYQWPMLKNGSRGKEKAEVELEGLVYELPILYKGKEIDLFKHLLRIKNILKRG
jgi:hypothetical protein